MKRVLAIIPARGGSKGIPEKNLVDLCGKPLIEYTIHAAKQSRLIDRLVVSTDCKKIASYAKKRGVEVLMRPDSLATDTSTTQSVLLSVSDSLVANGYSSDLIMTLQPTSPLRKSFHIDESIELFIASKDADSLVSCIELPHTYSPESIMLLSPDGYLVPYINNKNMPLRRQDKKSYFARNGAAIYITKTSRLKEFIFGGKLVPYFMRPDDSIDIDNFYDLACAKRILSDIHIEEQ